MLSITTALIIVVIILLIVACKNTMAAEDYLYGFWVAEADVFCEESEIESMMLFIGERAGTLYSTRECYLVIMNNLCNQSLTLSYWSVCPTLTAQYTIAATAEFDEAAIWPEHVQLTVDMQKGTLSIYSDEVLYAQLNKQHDTTNISRALLGADLVEATQ